MNLMMSIGAMMATTAADWAGVVREPVQRHPARANPSCGSVKRHRRTAAKARARKRARRLGNG